MKLKKSNNKLTRRFINLMNPLTKKSEQLSKTEYEEKILQLIKTAEMFLHWSKELYELYDEKYKKCTNWQQKQDFIEKRSVKYLVLHNVLYFFETALILNTLLKRGRKDSELSFENNFASDPNTFEKQIEEIRQLYIKSKIGTVRNKIIAHKDNKNIGDPIFHFMKRINKNFIDDADKIIKNLSEIALKNFSDLIVYNVMENYFVDSHKFIIEAIIREIN